MTINKLILAYPNTGETLLSNVYKNNGYHDFGPFFDTFRYFLTTDPLLPYAEKLSKEQQLQIRYTRQQRGAQVDDWTQTLMGRQRLKRFNAIETSVPNIATVFLHTFDYLPEAINLFEGREVLCLRRNDKFNHLLERSKEVIGLNAMSSTIKIDKAWFEFTFYSLLRLERLQTYCVESSKGRIIELDKLLDNQVDLGFRYSIEPEAESNNFTVSNLTEIEKLFENLCKKFNVNWK